MRHTKSAWYYLRLEATEDQPKSPPLHSTELYMLLQKMYEVSRSVA